MTENAIALCEFPKEVIDWIWEKERPKGFYVEGFDKTIKL